MTTNTNTLIIDTDTLSVVFTESELRQMTKAEAKSAMVVIAEMVEEETVNVRGDEADVIISDATGRSSTHPIAHEIFEAVLIAKADVIRGHFPSITA